MPRSHASPYFIGMFLFGEMSNDLLLGGKGSKRRAARFSSLFDDSTSHFSVTIEAEWCT